MADLGAIGDEVPVPGVNNAYVFSGTVLDDAGAPAQRLVRLHRRSDGGVIREVMSRADGAYTLPSTLPDEANDQYIVFFDDDAGTQYNHKILGRLTLP